MVCKGVVAESPPHPEPSMPHSPINSSKLLPGKYFDNCTLLLRNWYRDLSLCTTLHAVFAGPFADSKYNEESRKKPNSCTRAETVLFRAGTLAPEAHLTDPDNIELIWGHA